MITSKLINWSASNERRLIVKYALLTAALFLPLIWAFLNVRNLYPIAAWNVMMGGGNFERGRSYCMLRGETVSGETIDIRPIKLTNGLYSRTWTMVNATIANQSFSLSSIHPENEELMRRYGGVENLPQGVRLPDLLHCQRYNARATAVTAKWWWFQFIAVGGSCDAGDTDCERRQCRREIPAWHSANRKL